MKFNLGVVLQEYYYSTRGRILDDDEDPLTRPAPTSYPPPEDKAQKLGADEHEDKHAQVPPPSKKLQEVGETG